MSRRLEPNQILHGDSRELLKKLPDASVDSVVTDPPAGISFMGRTWDDPGTLGVSGGMAMPATTSSRNPSCRNCGGRKRAGEATKACQCETPDWNDLEYRIKDRQAFVDFLQEIMGECYRVLKPGGHAVVWALPRTSHWTAMAIENAGFEIRDCIYHVFGSGFPKSLNIGKAIDKLTGVDDKTERAIAAYLTSRREELGLSRADVDSKVFGSTTRYAFVEGRTNEDGNFRIYLPTPEEWITLKAVLQLDDRFDAYIQKAIPSREMRARADGGKAQLTAEGGGSYGYQESGERWDKTQRFTAPKSDDAKKWDGWGTALKPSTECWWLCRKPIDAANVAANVLKHGTGAINIDGCRVHSGPSEGGQISGGNAFGQDSGWNAHENRTTEIDRSMAAGRWPANLMLSHSEGCRKIGERQVEAPVINRFTDGMKPFGEGAGHPYESSGGGAETIPVYECVPGCPVKAMDEQSGVTSGGTPTLNSEVDRTAISTTSHNPRDPNQTGSVCNYGDAGGASRYFQTFDSKGRWPSNMVLSHAPGCVRHGTKKVKPSGSGTRTTALGIVNDDGWEAKTQKDSRDWVDADGMETVEDWECAEGCPVAEIDRQGREMGVHPAGSPQPAQEKYEMSEQTPSYGGGFSGPSGMRYGDEGGASRFFQTLEPEVPFFYTAKASRREKNDGLDEDFPELPSYMVENGSKTSGVGEVRYERKTTHRNTHPTVKAVSLMRYLVRMVTPKGGLVLDPFAGSGSTLIAAVEEGMQFVGIEREEEYIKIAERRVGVVAKRTATLQAERDIFEMMMNLGDDE